MPLSICFAFFSVWCSAQILVSALPSVEGRITNDAVTDYDDFDSTFGMNGASATKNANRIFSALHSSMRQWGSSLQHNGMSFFPAFIPTHTLFYHGSHSPGPVIGPEWLAFEIEHAEAFARPHPPLRNGTDPGGPGRGPPRPPRRSTDDGFEADQQEVLESPTPNGYLHTFRTTREVRLLYVDGMSAGKTAMGTLDSQDYVMRVEQLAMENTAAPRPHGPFDEYERAKDLCEWSKDLGIDGILRMEAGFEIIYCDFGVGAGLETVNVLQRPDSTERIDHMQEHFEYIRAVATRYGGIGGGRVRIYFSSMVSAYFYNLTLIDGEKVEGGLPRLNQVDEKARLKIKEDVTEMMTRHNCSGEEGHGPHFSRSTINWQDVVDMIVSRYSERLKFLAMSETSTQNFTSELDTMLNVFIDYNSTNGDMPGLRSSIERCRDHFLLPVSPRSSSDHLIATAITTVTDRICGTLFESRSILAETHQSKQNTSENADSLEKAKFKVEKLIKWLDWSTWLECGKCKYDEVCYVAIWPWGGREDHDSPGCKNRTMILSRGGYWDMSG